jgi:opacity protein-like surface antigen
MLKNIFAIVMAVIATPLIASAGNHKSDTFYGAVKVAHNWNRPGDTTITNQHFYGSNPPEDFSILENADGNQSSNLTLAIGKSFDLAYDDAGNSVLALRGEFDWQKIDIKNNMSMSEVSYSGNFSYYSDPAKAKLNMTSTNAMVSAYLDYSLTNWMDIYAGAGLGIAMIDFDMLFKRSYENYDLSDSFNKFTYKLAIGMAFNIAYRTTIDFGYNFIAVPNIEMSFIDYPDSYEFSKYMFEQDAYTHQINLGIRYKY